MQVSVLLAALFAFYAATVHGQIVTAVTRTVTHLITTFVSTSTSTIYTTAPANCLYTYRRITASTLTETLTQTASVTVCPIPRCGETFQTYGYCQSGYFCSNLQNLWSCTPTTIRCGENNQNGFCDNNTVCRKVNNQYGCYTTPF